MHLRISWLLIWRESLALPRQLASIHFLGNNIDLAEDMKSQLAAMNSDASLLTIRGDRLVMRLANQTYLRHAFSEIFKNTFLAAERAGRSKKLFVKFRRQEKYGVVVISDLAAGVEPGQFDKMFCIGYSLSGSGNGLGWAIVRRIVNVHLGALEIENIPGVGINVTITLPLEVEKEGE